MQTFVFEPERGKLEVEFCLHRHHTCLQIGHLLQWKRKNVAKKEGISKEE